MASPAPAVSTSSPGHYSTPRGTTPLRLLLPSGRSCTPAEPCSSRCSFALPENVTPAAVAFWLALPTTAQTWQGRTHCPYGKFWPTGTRLRDVWLHPNGLHHPHTWFQFALPLPLRASGCASSVKVPSLTFSVTLTLRSSSSWVVGSVTCARKVSGVSTATRKSLSLFRSSVEFRRGSGK